MLAQVTCLESWILGQHAQWTEKNTTEAARVMELTTILVSTLQIVWAFLNLALFTNGILILNQVPRRQWMLEQLSLIDELVLLQFLLAFTPMWQAWGLTRLIYLLLALLHMRQIDLTRHWWCCKTVFFKPSCRCLLYAYILAQRRNRHEVDE